MYTNISILEMYAIVQLALAKSWARVERLAIQLLQGVGVSLEAATGGVLKKSCS